MNGPLPCRIIVDATAAGSWQMAVDEVLLESAAQRQTASLRFYGWSEPTLSLGYFQSFRDAQAHPAGRESAIVRRQTGGGAILHDDELTYCLALPLAHPLAAHAEPLYLAVHEALRAVLSALGIDSSLREQTVGVGRDAEPFLCFLRQARGDVLLGETKICGSAQRRRRGAVLQHGSLLLAASDRAPELPGIAQRAGRRLEPIPLASDWLAGICQRLHLTPSPGELAPQELADVRRLTLEKYTAASWNRRR